ncbi:hypothetical protein HPB50_001709 [Hyalomma asiaticum]|uniref:Uncharacterized protein n=1 Tax=Hyalomma asiaticum TaxID=266040 RepID=A0ACB7SU92_HYAAI|nr:hypothetical protein HPB50_001709 [Hyalomma asiaticum]
MDGLGRAGPLLEPSFPPRSGAWRPTRAAFPGASCVAFVERADKIWAPGALSVSRERMRGAPSIVVDRRLAPSAGLLRLPGARGVRLPCLAIDKAGLRSFRCEQRGPTQLG